MKAPVKIVVFVRGGVVQEVMTCGVPCDVAVIDADCEEGDELTEHYPEYMDPAEIVTYTANGFVWRLRGNIAAANLYALKCFEIADKANGGGK